jgi:hypothetical protein
MYADWAFYTDKYLLGDTPTIPEPSFPRWITRASEHIDLVTFNRIKTAIKYDADGDIESEGIYAFSEDIQNLIQLAACALAEHIFLYETAKRAAALQAAQGVLIIPSGVTAKQLETAKTEEYEHVMRGIVQKYLENTGLLFRGV